MDWHWQLSFFDFRSDLLRATVDLTAEQAAPLLALFGRDPVDGDCGELQLDENVFIGPTQGTYPNGRKEPKP